MKKLSLLLVLMLLMGSVPVNPALAGTLQTDPMALPTDAPSASFSLPEGYDPASEEDNGSYSVYGAAYNDYGRSLYAGTTPIPLDPIDMPTPTPKPTLTFSYGAVTADKLRLSFEAPVGWGIDASADDAITLINQTALDGYNAYITIRVYSVASTFKLADLRDELRNTLKEIGQYNFAKWSTKEIATRQLLKKDGYYNDYEGQYYDGTAIYGRVMMALLDGHQVIMVHLSCPDGYFNSSYKAVINHVRDTLKQI
ncbi:MAG: hypothetical protein IKN04_18130 [Clostridia bacterium]|nr:hypothetical protein [Clostridia bacterium]